MIAKASIEADLLGALEAATKELITERDCFYDSITDQEGNIFDPDDEAPLRQLDALIDQCRTAIAKAKGGES